MNQREQAAWEAHEFFTQLDVRYAFIGGTAVQYWASRASRQTLISQWRPPR